MRSNNITPVIITPDIQRFIDAQEIDHYRVVVELKRGKKISHWMWYTFPQIKGLGFSDIAKYYEIQSLDELDNYVHSQYLVKNLRECCKVLLRLPTNSALAVFGPIDALKLQSSMTLFTHTRKLQKYAHAVLDKYFKGNLDVRTEVILRQLSGEGSRQ